jgi:type IV secretion system protein VirB10
MIDGFTDPYEQADQQLFSEAKLVTPQPAKKSWKIVVAGLVLAGLVLGMVILAGIGGMLARKSGRNAPTVMKPVTMTKQEGQNFAQQQAGQAAYMAGQDRDKNLQRNEDTILGNGNDVAADPYDETNGVPKKTKAQDDAEHGRHNPGGGGKSDAEQLRERAMLEAQRRRQADLDSSPVSVDFSDYFDKEKTTPAATPAATVPATAVEPVTAEKAKLDLPPAVTEEVTRRHRVSDALRADGEERGEGEDREPALNRKQAHDPSEDYAFDSASGKLYRLMEDTIIETVLVNRLSGAAVGPVISMVTTDVYSGSGFHLLIPKGTRLLGRVTAVASLNQERLFVAFHRAIMPDGYSVSLDRFQGLDVVGQTGLRDLVNHHYVQIFGAAIALAAVSAAAQVGNNGGSYGTYDWGVSMRNGVSQGLGQSAQRVMERFLNVLPTFTIRERAIVKIMLSNDLKLPDTKNHTMDPDL